jgi:hypothetical protein
VYTYDSVYLHTLQDDMLQADIPGFEELQAIADEEGMPVEQ